jgi:hypothetical protein
MTDSAFINWSDYVWYQESRPLRDSGWHPLRRCEGSVNVSLMLGDATFIRSLSECENVQLSMDPTNESFAQVVGNLFGPIPIRRVRQQLR